MPTSAPSLPWHVQGGLHWPLHHPPNLLPSFWLLLPGNVVSPQECSQTPHFYYPGLTPFFLMGHLPTPPPQPTWQDKNTQLPELIPTSSCFTGKARHSQPQGLCSLKSRALTPTFSSLPHEIILLSLSSYTLSSRRQIATFSLPSLYHCSLAHQGHPPGHGSPSVLIRLA